ncbi:MAG: hypothetical protein K0Q83_47 [Deltaproteobacteria bacterium]|nr:hypothetical protein [Deltaproteobacteria bacterium]
MLSAKQDENRAGPTASRVSSPSAGSVGKVVNSIQGLQQRLNDYTLEEVSAAENRSRTLLLGLLNLQSRVGSLVAIKRSMTVVYEAVEKTASEDIKLSVIDTSGKPIHLRDIIQASNLIKFPGLKRTLPKRPEHTVTTASPSGETISGAMDTSQSIRDVIRQDSVADRREATDSPEEPAFVFGTTEIEGASGIPSTEFSWDKDSDSVKTIGDSIRYEHELQTTAVRSASEKINKPQSDISVPEFAPKLPLPEEPNTPISTALVPTGGDFDQRLLDDLIKNYGEFFSSSDSPSKVVPRAHIDTVEAGSKPIILEKPAVESPKNKTARTSPLKKEGDIDRELKKIIKDYGEYDIYSHKNRINLKFAGVGAFLLLVAVLSGFYFLSSSKSQEPSSPPAAAESVSRTSDENTSGMRELKQAAKASETKTNSKSPNVKK